MADVYFSNVQMKDGTIVNVKDELAREQLANKVDKVQGMGLSSNDFTSAEKSKLAGIASGAEINVIESVAVNGNALPITNKGVDVTVPTKTSDLTNDSDFISVSYDSTNERITFLLRE